MTSSPTQAAPRTRPRVLLAFGLVLAAALRAAWSTLDRGFLGDDFAYIGRFHRLAFSEWPTLFVREWSGGLWGHALPELRPFAALTFLIDTRLWGTNPLGYHLTNFALDAGCACLVFLLVWRLHRAALWAGCAAGILFAWHPAHVEPVAWITGRVDLLGTLAYLAGFLAAGFYLRDQGSRRWLVMAWLAYAIGCFSKEFCLTLPIALLLWMAIYRPAAGWRQILILFGGFVAVAGIFVLCRRLAFGPGSGGVLALNLFSAAHAERQLDYLRWYFPPFYHVGRDFRPYLATIAPPLIVVIFLLGPAVLALWRWTKPATTRWRAVAFYLFGWYLIATLPMAAASYFSARHLYLATAGLAIGAGVLAGTFAHRRGWATGLVVLAAFSCAGQFDHAVAPWRRSAKLSERFSAEIARAVPALQPGELLLVDAPDVHEGAWLWAWAAPFALQPPFQNPPATSVVLTHPADYYAPHLWTQQPAFRALASATGAVLISLDANRSVVSRPLSRAQLTEPARRLMNSAAAEPGIAWREFVTTLSAR